MAALVLTGFAAEDGPTAPGSSLGVWRHPDGDANAGPEYAHMLQLAHGIKLDVRFAVGTISYADQPMRAPVRVAVNVIEAPNRRVGANLENESPGRRPGDRPDSLSFDLHVASRSTAAGCTPPDPAPEITVLRLRADGRIDQEAPRPMMSVAELEKLATTRE